MGLASKDRYLVSDAIILRGQRIPLRLLKNHGVTHAVAFCPPRPETEAMTVAACRMVSDVPWSRTSRFRPSRIDCMGCLVVLGRL